MTNQSDTRKLAEQMASSMNSFDDIKDFQKQLMQSFIDTALEAEMEGHLGYPKDVRKFIYTINAIESLSSMIRTEVNKRKVFPSDRAAFKVVYLATQQASKTWSMVIRNWTSALNRFMIMFDDRISSI